MEITLNDLRDLLGTQNRPQARAFSGVGPKLYDKVLIRTVTQFLTGQIVAMDDRWIVLDTAAWIALTGRLAEAIAHGFGSSAEIEPMGDGVAVAVGAIVDVTPWHHDLPTTVS